MEPRLTEQIPRRGHHTGAAEFASGAKREPAVWSDVAERLRGGEATTWLSVRSDTGVHTRPVFAAWTGGSFVFASNPRAVKTRHLETDGHVSLGIDLSELHLVVEGLATRLVARPDLERVVTAMQEVYGWPTEVEGDLLDAPYAAPTSGGPPFRAYEISPVVAHAFPTSDQFEPTRFTW